MWWNNRHLALLLLASTLGCAGIEADAKDVCPARANEKVKQIDIFDGKPEELAFLAPDDDEKAPNTYTLKNIYEQGRIVTIRCTYDSGFIFELPMKDKVDNCHFSRSKAGVPKLVCK